MYKIFHENKALIFPKIEGNVLKFDATPLESDRYNAELLCNFLPEWLDDHDPGDTFIHEVGENAVALALKETFNMAPAAGGIVVTDGKFVSIVRHGIPDLPKGHIEQGETPDEEPNLAVAIIAQASSFAATARSPPISSNSPESPLPTTPPQLLLMTTALFERLEDSPRNPSRWKQSNLEATISFFQRNNIISF